MSCVWKYIELVFLSAVYHILFDDFSPCKQINSFEENTYWGLYVYSKKMVSLCYTATLLLLCGELITSISKKYYGYGNSKIWFTYSCWVPVFLGLGSLQNAIFPIEKKLRRPTILSTHVDILMCLFYYIFLISVIVVGRRKQGYLRNKKQFPQTIKEGGYKLKNTINVMDNNNEIPTEEGSGQQNNVI